MALPSYNDPRQQLVQPDPADELVAKAKHESAEEALGVICDVFYDGFQVLLHRDRLVDVYGEQELNAAFNRLMDKRRHR